MSLFALFKYFLYVGATAFGGPLAIIESIRNDLVNKKRWLTQTEFENIFGYAQIAPGPLAFQVALYIGRFKKGIAGSIVSGFALVLPSYLLVLLFSIFYKEYRNIDAVKYALYGLGPVIIAIIFHSGFKLGYSLLKKDIFLYVIAAVSIILTIFFKVYIILIVISSALISLIYYSAIRKKLYSIVPLSLALISLAFSKLILFRYQLIPKLEEIAILFLKVGSLTYGSGFVIVGVLRQEVVDRLHWLTPNEFIDGIAFGQITPGPVVITSTFIGYFTSGIIGSIVSTFCIFFPTFIFVLIISWKINSFKDNFYLKAFIRGANASAIGAILATAFFLSKDGIVDIPTVILFFAGMGLLFYTKIKPFVLVLLAVVAGIAIKFLYFMV